MLIVYISPLYDRVDADKVKLSVSMKKHNPCIKNLAILESCIVLLLKVVTLFKCRNMRRVVPILPLSSSVFPGKWDDRRESEIRMKVTNTTPSL